MKILIAAIRNTPIFLHWLLAGSILILFLKFLWLDNIPSFFPKAQEMGEMVKDILVANIAGYAFYILSAELPKISDQRHTAKVILQWAEGAANNITDFLQIVFSENQNKRQLPVTTINPTNVTADLVKGEFKMVKPSDVAPMLQAAGQSFSDGLFTTILWGYPRNMRGSTFQGILAGVEQIQSALPEEKELSKDRFLSVCKELNGTGIGLSTLTKMLYFFRYKVEGLPCLIFDRRIIEVCNEQAFSELLGLVQITDFNKCNKYQQFLEIIHNIAKANRYKPDQLELFLFQFGNSLKPINVSATTV